jgi:acyl-CoA synthetase (AMP-forming)/AMP-acid ligase II
VSLPSPYPPVVVPDVSVTELVLGRTDREGDVALIDGLTGQSWTYAQLRGRVAQAARRLEERGIAKGDVVGIVAPNSPQHAVLLHAVLSLGAIVTPVNPLSTAEELKRHVRDARASWVFTVSELAETARAAAAAAGARAEPIDAIVDHATESGEAILPRPSLAPADLALLPYSSGTSGTPKGVMLTHRNLVANLVQVSAMFPFERGEVVLAALPFFHITGIQLLLNLSLANGAAAVMMPRFELARFLSLIEEHRVTRTAIVPPIALALSRDPSVDAHDLSSLRLMLCGAAPLSPEVRAACEQRVGCPVYQGYGLTETSPVATHVVESDATLAEGSVGAPAPGTEIRIVDGEVWVRGPQVMRGYLDRPEETARALNGDGWLRTGDLGYVDERGRLHIVDRLKELIKYKGFQVAPAELEAVLLTHPAVADVAVIPSPSEEAGEVPKALVVARRRVEAQELMEHVARRVAPQKKVRRVEFVDEIPKSPSGKILRRRLVERERRR